MSRRGFPATPACPPDAWSGCAVRRSLPALLMQCMKSMGLSMRAYTRVLRVARTIADLAGSERVEEEHIAEAASYRGSNEKYWK